MMNLMNLQSMMSSGPEYVDPHTLAQYTNKSFLLHSQSTSLADNLNRSGDGLMSPRARTSCTTSVAQGKGASVELIPDNRVDIETLTQSIDKALHGKFFLGRTITPPIKITSIMTIVEDPKGEKAVLLALYNYSNSEPSDAEGLRQDLPVGQIVAIKNPWFKSTVNGGYALRSDNPGDVVFLTQSSFEDIFTELKWECEIPTKWQHLVKTPPQTAVEWKNEGNKLFVNRKYEQAIHYYSEGLRIGKSSQTVTQVDIDILANRAAAYLSLECFHKALEDSERVLEIKPHHSKAIYRKGRSMYGLGRYSDTITFLSEHADKMDDYFNNLINELMNKAKLLAKQQATGKYDILKLYQMGSVYHDDVADFTGPIKIENIPGKGRGMIATEEIQAGQLVLVSKAFTVIFKDKLEAEFNINTNTKYINTASQRMLIQKITSKLRMDPVLRRELFQLYAGSENPIPEESKVEFDLDIKRIESICFYNSFGGIVSEKPSNKEDFKLGARPYVEKGCSGIWMLPSFINHSCWDCNCTWINFGDVMFIRSFKKIAAGQEILISYVSPAASYGTRDSILKKHRFLCECRLCKLDRGTNVDELKRKEMLAKLEKCYESKDVGGMLELVKKIDRLEPRLKINPSIVSFLVYLGGYFTVNMKKLHESNDMLYKARVIAENSALIIAGHGCVNSSVNILGNFILMNDKKNILKWIEILKKDLLIAYGTVEMARIEAEHALVLLQRMKIPFF